MVQYLLKRILYMFITLIGISVISWVIITQAPGSPVALTLDPKVSPKIIEQMKKNYDLDKPLYQQYFLWIQRLVTGKLYSFKDGRPVLKSAKGSNTLLLISWPLIIFPGDPLFFSQAAEKPLGHLDFEHLGISIWILLAYLLILGTVKLFGYPVQDEILYRGLHDDQSSRIAGISCFHRSLWRSVALRPFPDTLAQACLR
jgi:hypothetical protein